MKYYIPFLIALVFISCKKSRYDKYAAGSDKRMTVTEHNFKIQGFNTDGLNRDVALVDLNGDGKVDIEFVSNRDSIYLGEGSEVWGITLEIINPLIEFVEIQNSGDKYYTETSYISSGDPGYPTSDRTKTMGCQQEGGELIADSGNSPKTLSENDIIQPEQYDWSANQYGYLELGTSGYTYTECVFNEAYDSVFCDITIIEPTCYPIPTDEKTYLVFRKLDNNGCYSIGWIEVLLTDENRLEIRRSAISNKSLKP